jgi:hypothetical protein
VAGSGTVLAFGRGMEGQLGTGAIQRWQTPTEVRPLPCPASEFLTLTMLGQVADFRTYGLRIRFVAAGGDTSFALTGPCVTRASGLY